jgi:hypothetical protein
MKPNIDRAPAETADKVELPAKPRRFRIQKLEDRIAPKKGGKGTNNCTTGSLNCTY